MQRTHLQAGILVVVLATQLGCFTTRIHTDAKPVGIPQEHRQWFTIGGLVSLSPPAGRECEGGLATAESSLGAVDVLIHVGLAVGGGLLGGAACASSTDPQTRAWCASSGAFLAPFLLGSRTVSYTCNSRPRNATFDLKPAGESLATNDDVPLASQPLVPSARLLPSGDPIVAANDRAAEQP
jgi:hypothetical protein